MPVKEKPKLCSSQFTCQFFMCYLGERGLTIKRKIPSICSKEVTYRLCRALKDCLCVNEALTTIELQGVPLRQRDVAVLAKVCRLVIHCFVIFCHNWLIRWTGDER